MVSSSHFLLLSLLILTASSWTCGVTPSWKQHRPAAFSQSRQLQNATALSRESTLGHFRIKAVYGDMTSISQARVQRIKNVIMPGVLKWYSNILLTYNILGNLTLHPGDCGGVPIPTNHTTVGVPDTDLILYVTATYTSEDWAARAEGCAFDSGNSLNNPIAGWVELNGYYFDWSLDPDNEVAILRHEIAHVLAFNSDYFGDLWKSNGFPYKKPVLSTTVRGTATTLLATPSVVAKAKEAFACPSLKGLELENMGGNGTAGSHWKKRIMFNDFMVGNAVTDNIYSDVTFAVFEDSGWYKVNYTYADSIRFGRGEGCKFFTSKCVVKGKAQLEEFCDNSTYQTCDLYGNRKAYCGLKNFISKLPSAFQYFSDQTLGGYDPLMDYCPHAEAEPYGNCKGGLDSATIDEVIFGEATCPDCKCFTGTYARQGLGTNTTHNGCHEVKCYQTSAFITVGKTVLQCPIAGGKISNIPGFDGFITCPPYAKLCGGNQPCPAGCFGFGMCVAGVCQCDDRHIGVDCSVECDESCKTCSDAGPVNCTSCYPLQVLFNGTCSCDIGKVFDVRKKVCVVKNFTCDASCATCFAPGPYGCLTCKNGANRTLLSSCECPDGEFLSVLTGSCVQCHPSCATCLGPTALLCTSCPSASTLPLLKFIGPCSCGDYFYTSKTTGTCELCPFGCSTCSDNSTCTSCYQNLTLDGTMCVCPSGFYASWNGCLPCHQDCKECSGPMGIECSKCKASAAAVVQGGGCVCQKGQFLAKDGSGCQSCNAKCRTCFGPDEGQCLVCQDNAFMSSSLTCECLPGYFLTVAGLCESCPPRCLSCKSKDVCVSCKAAGAVFASGLCGCGPRKYLSEDATNCLDCDRSCKECVGPGASNCTSCLSTAVLSAVDVGACNCPANYSPSPFGLCLLQCAPNCRTCISTPTTCTSCNVTVSKLVSKACECLPKAYKATDGGCLLCDLSCATCQGDGPLMCLTCPGTTVLKAAAPSSCVKAARRMEGEEDQSDTIPTN